MSLSNNLLIIQQNMNRYFCSISLTFGIIGCIFNILLFSKKQFRNISCCTYFLAASIIMIMALIIGFVPHVYTANHPNSANTISIVCKIRGYAGQSIGMIYRWLMTMACIDRYIVSSVNIQLRKFAKPHFAYRIVIIVIIIFIILPLHNLIFLDIIEDLCINSTNIFAIYHSIFTITLGGFLPSLIMIIFVILIRYNLLYKRQYRRRNNHNKKRSLIVGSLNTRDYQVIIMLFVQIVFYIFLTIPWMIFLLYAAITRIIPMNKSNDRIAIEKFVRYLTEIIVYLYPTLSFYIYTLTSKTFRRELFNIISSLFICKNRSWYSPRSLLIKVKFGWKDNCEQSNKNQHFHLLERQTFSNCSSTNVSSLTEPKTIPLSPDSTSILLLSIHQTRNEE